MDLQSNPTPEEKYQKQKNISPFHHHHHHHQRHHQTLINSCKLLSDLVP